MMAISTEIVPNTLLFFLYVSLLKTPCVLFPRYLSFDLLVYIRTTYMIFVLFIFLLIRKINPCACVYVMFSIVSVNLYLKYNFLFFMFLEKVKFSFKKLKGQDPKTIDNDIVTKYV